jgi:isochorismate pyruvate lyase
MVVNSLEQLRQEIDRLDREIIALLAERGGYVKQAVRFKSSVSEVEAPQRVEQVIGRIRRIADENGLSPEVAEATYRAMITAFVALERAQFESRNRD